MVVFGTAILAGSPQAAAERTTTQAVSAHVGEQGQGAKTMFTLAVRRGQDRIEFLGTLTKTLDHEALRAARKRAAHALNWAGEHMRGRAPWHDLQTAARTFRFFDVNRCSDPQNAPFARIRLVVQDGSSALTPFVGAMLSIRRDPLTPIDAAFAENNRLSLGPTAGVSFTF